jgi:hypothetical protein
MHDKSSCKREISFSNQQYPVRGVKGDRHLRPMVGCLLLALGLYAPLLSFIGNLSGLLLEIQSRLMRKKGRLEGFLGFAFAHQSAQTVVCVLFGSEADGQQEQTIHLWNDTFQIVHDTVSFSPPPTTSSGVKHGGSTPSLHPKIQTESASQATEFEIRQRNAKFSSAVRAGKNPVNPSRRDALAKRSPINIWALGIIIFVVIGGGTPSDLTPHLPTLTTSKKSCSRSQD